MGHNPAVPHLIDNDGQAVRAPINIGSVHLVGVTHQYNLGVHSHSGDYGLQLVNRGVLGLIDNNEGIIECPPPDV